MTNKEFQELAVKTVVDYFNNRSEKTDKFEITPDDVYIVWLCKSVVWAYLQAYVAAVKAIFHLFTDIFGQISPIFYCQI